LQLHAIKAALPQTVNVKTAPVSYTFAIVLAALAAANCSLFLYFMERASIRVPVYDMLDWLQFYGARAQDGDWLSYLWTPHNEHRMVLSRALLALDVRWFDGRGTAFVISGLLLLAVAAAAICSELMKSDLSIEWKLAAIPISILLLLPAHTVVTVGVPLVAGSLQTSAFALFALALLDGASEKGRFSPYRRVAAISAACLAAFGLAAGLLIWPALVWSAWRGSLRWPWVAGIACIGILFTTIYLWNLPLRTVSTPLGPARLVQSFDYAIRFLGLPWSHLDSLVWPGRLIGLGVLCLGSFALISETLAPRPSNRLHRFGLGLVLFSFLVAASAALARLEIGEDREMPIRYGMFVVLAQLGLLFWSLDFLQRFSQRGPWPSLQWVVVGLSVVWLCQQVVVGQRAVAEADQYNDAWLHFVAGEWTPEMSHYVYPYRQGAETGLANLRKMGIYRGP
jgi:hypothetical protein